MTVINYNGTGFWSVDAVLARYAQYARHFGISALRDLQPLVHSHDGKQWVYPVMNRVIEGIESGDPACAQIGVEFIEQDGSFDFGRILKSNAARALRRTPLTEEQKERIRKRVVEMLAAGYLPGEYRQYAKLARKIGLGGWLSQLDGKINMSNPWVERYYNYFKEHAAH